MEAALAAADVVIDCSHPTASLPLFEHLERHGTPVVIVDHEEIRRNYAAFRKHLPRVQCYFAVKANAEPAIVRTLYKSGASFDVASLTMLPDRSGFGRYDSTLATCDARAGR